MDERQCFMGPFIAAQLTERQHTDAELFRAMHNVLSAQITKLSATITMLSAGSQTYRAQERVGQSLLLRACVSGTSKREQQLAVAQARVLVFDLGSTTPFLKDEFQDLRFVITDRVVNGAPVWAAVGGVWFMYRSVQGFMWIGDAGNCTEGKSKGCMYNVIQASGGLAPSDLSSGFWLSDKRSTLSSQYASAQRVSRCNWVIVPAMRITVVHGLDDGDPTMAAALQQLATHS
jgi:hypothetical protein